MHRTAIVLHPHTQALRRHKTTFELEYIAQNSETYLAAALNSSFTRTRGFMSLSVIFWGTAACNDNISFTAVQKKELLLREVLEKGIRLIFKPEEVDDVEPKTNLLFYWFKAKPEIAKNWNIPSVKHVFIYQKYQTIIFYSFCQYFKHIPCMRAWYLLISIQFQLCKTLPFLFLQS